MVDPIAELEAEKAKFISIRELFTLLEKKYPHIGKGQLAEWLIKRLCHESNCDVYKQGIAGHLTSAGDGWGHNGYDDNHNPFLTSLLSQIMANNDLPTKPIEQSYTELPTHLANEFDFSEFDEIPF